jgi:PIN domain nuclease of toxin-antitoxin system
VRLLIDSHTLYWAVGERSRLSNPARAALEDQGNDVYVSVVSLWEMAIKAGSGKWPEVLQLVERFEFEIEKPGFRLLPISVPHVRLAGLMPSPHRDPFDRLLAAQATIEGLTLVSSDAKMANLGAEVLW